MVAYWKYAARRLLFALLTLFAVSVLAYLLTLSVQGRIFQETRNIEGASVQGFLSWLWNALQGDLGPSLDGLPVLTVIAPWVLPTLELQIPAVLASVAAGLLIGVYAASHRNSKRDGLISALTATLYGLPAYWLATLAIIVFSLELHLLPSFGIYSPYPPYWWGNPVLDQVAHYVLPFTVMFAVSVPVYVRVARTSAIDVMSEDWVSAATLASVSRGRVVYRHVLKNSAGPALGLIGYNLAILLALSPGVEVAFTWPGMGLGFVGAALKNDFRVMLGIIILMAIFAVVANLVVDLVHARIDPRVTL